jgi:hypothetical protein
MLVTWFMLVPPWSILRPEDRRGISSETSDDFQQNALRYVTEDRDNTSYPSLWEPQILREQYVRYGNMYSRYNTRISKI